MSDLQDDILKEFREESKTLLKELVEILDGVEDHFDLVSDLENYGQTVDRIMGGAKSLALSFPPDHFIHQIGDYSALCKAVSYKASQIENNENFFNVCVALLMDATEVLETMILNLGSGKPLAISQMFNHTFLDRLRWISSQFAQDVRSSVGVSREDTTKKLSQNEIDDLMKKLGLF
jgi:hypothetical protein